MSKLAKFLLLICFLMAGGIAIDAQSRGPADFDLLSRSTEAFAMAQDLFGPAEKVFKVEGIKFKDRGPEHIFPGGLKKKKVVILLHKSSASNEQNALYQLSHEVFHLLAPSIKGKAIYLEEGLAVYFSLLYLRKIGKPVTRDYIRKPEYREAYDDLVALSQTYPDLVEQIKTTRRRLPDISDISYQEFKRTFPLAPDTLARRLTTLFP